MVKRIFNNLIPPSGGQRFPALDGLRAVAVLAVMISHLPIPGVTTKDLHHPAGIGVGIFFVLAAFLLYYPPVKKRKGFDVGHYYKRRFYRIMPAYLIALAFGSIVGIALGKIITAEQVISHIFFIHTLKKELMATIIGVAWTLPAEVQFYAILPIFAALFAARSTVYLLLATCVAIAAQLLVPTREPLWNNWPALALPFFIGMVAATATARYSSWHWIGLLPPVGFIILLFVTLSYYFHYPNVAPEWGTVKLMLFNYRGLLPSIGAGMMMVGLASVNRGIWLKLFTYLPLRILGIAGYGIFLFHGTIIAVMGKIGGTWYAIGAGVPLAICAGIISYLYIEAPCIRYAAKCSAPNVAI